MNILTVGAAGVAAVLLAVWMKGVRGEYALYVVIAAQLFFLFYGIGRLKEILDIIRQMESYIKIRPVYLVTLLKMTGVLKFYMNFTLNFTLIAWDIKTPDIHTVMH